MRKEVCRSFLATILVAIVPALVVAQRNESGFLNRSVEVNGSEYRYVVYVPREFTRNEAWPVIVQLHVDVAVSRKMTATLKSVGASVLYTEFPGVDHNGATNAAYARADLIEWMLKQGRR